MNEYGPSRGELWFRVVVGIAGLIAVVAVTFAGGIPNSAALVEVLGIGGLFFGGTLFFAVRGLMRLPKG